MPPFTCTSALQGFELDANVAKEVVALLRSAKMALDMAAEQGPTGAHRCLPSFSAP